MAYNPRKSNASTDARAAFIQASIQGDIQEVIGIGPANAKLLAAGKPGDRVTNTFQLVAKFLSFTPNTKNGKPDCKKHCDDFHEWLQTKGVGPLHSHGIVQVLAEKLDCTFPGLYDERQWK